MKREKLSELHRFRSENKLNIKAKRFKNSLQISTSFTDKYEFLRRHSKVFLDCTLLDCGDADSYFKKSLRNYDSLDLHSLKQSRRATSQISFKSYRSKSTKKTKLLVESEQISSLKSEEEINLDRAHSQTSVFKSAEGSTLNTEQYYSLESVLEESVHNQTNNNLLAIENNPENMADEEEGIATEEENVAEEEEEEAEDTGGEDLGEDEEAEGLEGEETEGDELAAVEELINEATKELNEVAQSSNLLLFGEDEEDEEEGQMGRGDIADGSFFKFDPKIDSAILRELEEAERQAKETGKTIYEIKARITELMKKEKCTEIEAKELEEKNKELGKQMLLFEEKTKRIQFLIGQSNLFESMVPPKPALQQKYAEDKLPKMIICGPTMDNIPKFIVCDDLSKKKSSRKGIGTSGMIKEPCYSPPKQPAEKLQPKSTSKECECIIVGDRRSQSVNKDTIIQELQQRLHGLQSEMAQMNRENFNLCNKMQDLCATKTECERKQQMTRKPCRRKITTCPTEIESRLTEYSETTKQLEKQLVEMESDVKNMQSELTAVQNEREHLEQHKKIIICPPICIQQPPSVCMPPPASAPCIMPQQPCVPQAIPCPMPFCSDQAIRELREQYYRLQDDFRSKVTEVSGLRADNEKLKNSVKEGEEKRKIADEKIKECEKLMKSMNIDKNQLVGSKEALIEQEQQLAVAKQRFREAQDELEELRNFVSDQQGQIDDYRNKYLEAQQGVEEQKRQIELMQMEALRENEQVSLEMQRIKNQFQEKLEELMPLPEVLKTTQVKLQEAQQMHLMAERNNDVLARDLKMYQEKVALITGQMEQVRSDIELDGSHKATLSSKLEELERKYAELEEEKDATVSKLDESERQLMEAERKLQENAHEIAQLSAQLESVREESARQVARNKERCETVRRTMQNQISDLERQLVQSRAQARGAQKDRDEVRQKMQAQIRNLHENFEDAQMRIRNLQGHVNFLKVSCNTTDTSMTGDGNQFDENDPCYCGQGF